MTDPSPADLQLRILRTDNNSYGPEWSGVRLNDHYYRLYVLAEGEAQVIVNDEPVDLRAGHSYLFPRTWRFDHACPRHMRMMNVCFDISAASSLDLLTTRPYQTEVPLDRPDEGYAAMAMIAGAWERPDLASQLRVRGLMLQMLSPHFDCPATAQSLSRLEQLRRLKPALDRIHDHAGGTVSIGDLCRLTNMSRSNFARLFREAQGISTQDYVRNLRVTRAKHLLAESRWSMARIAEQLGYSSQSYFTREFKALAGTTPRRFREGGDSDAI